MIANSVALIILKRSAKLIDAKFFAKSSVAQSIAAQEFDKQVSLLKFRVKCVKYVYVTNQFVCSTELVSGSVSSSRSSSFIAASTYSTVSSHSSSFQFSFSLRVAPTWGLAEFSVDIEANRYSARLVGGENEKSVFLNRTN